MNEDKRITATKATFKEALIELMKSYSPEQITVRMICENCDINRSTFYRHYPSVATLYREVHNSILDEIIGFLNNIHNINSATDPALYEEWLHYMLMNREKCIAILSNQITAGLEKELSKRYLSQLRLNIHFNPDSQKDQYLHSFLSGGIINAAWCWLLNPDKVSEKEMALFLCRMVKNSIQ